MHEITLRQTSPTSRVLAGAVPAGLGAHWCVLHLPRMERGARAIIALDLGDDMALTAVATRRLLLFVPAEARTLRLELLGTDPPSRLGLRARALSRFGALARLFLRGPRRVLRAAVGGRAGWRRRVRAALAQGNAEAPPETYALWTTLFDQWSDDDIARLLASPRRPAWPEMAALVIGGGEAARATLDSLAAQARPVRAWALPEGAPLAPAISEPYLAILQAGEVLPRHATALLGEWMARNGTPAALCADEDVIGRDGARDAPLFKPEPNRTLMLSGTLTRGLWLFRRDLPLPATATHAEALRLELWLRLHEAGHGAETRRIPFILAHRRAGTEAAPADVIAGIVRAHLARTGRTARIEQSTPLRVRPVLAGARGRRVALIVPSALRAPHVPRCLRAVLDTDHDALELLLVVSQISPLDATQRATLEAIGDDRRLRVLQFGTERFNYAAANNFAARETDAEFLCLLNDDVAPERADWLDAMLGHFADSETGAVGARLLYENGTVQHGGIIIGLAGLAEHANQFLPRSAPGYAHRAVMSQELSAVTGACLLTRRADYVAIGGLDEEFPIAFNDVDYCLKLRQAGRRVIFCAEAELTHFESLSLGHHFSGERAALEREEVRQMRRRWADIVAADPFHNPNLSLARGREWNPAFPPRVRKSAWLER